MIYDCKCLKSFIFKTIIEKMQDSDLVESYERASKKQKTTINILTSEIDNLIEYVDNCKKQIQDEGKL